MPHNKPTPESLHGIAGGIDEIYRAQVETSAELGEVKKMA